MKKKQNKTQKSDDDGDGRNEEINAAICDGFIYDPALPNTVD